MKTIHGLALSALVLSPALFAQTERAGFTLYVSVGATSRGQIAGNAGCLLNRFEYDQLRGWGQDGTALSLAQRTIHGVYATLQDQDRATPQQLWWVVYGEDTANPNYPDPTKQIARVSFPFPFTGTGIGAMTVTASFATPVTAPVKQDLFLGLETDAVAAPGWPTDGVSANIVLGNQPSSTFLVYDLGGPALGTTGPRNTYGCSWVLPASATNIPKADGPRMYLFDPILGEIGGTATAVTNQTSFTISNTAPGTTSWLSGLNPDAKNPPLNAGRVDDIGYVLKNTAAAGLPVLFALSADFGAEIPLGAGNGVLCADLQTMLFLGPVAATATGEASIVLPIPANIRSNLMSKLVWQAFVLDPVQFRIMGTPCAKQTF